ncbi:MAG TPA: aminodeoxychorismate/anthranilate synthase component II [Bacteroidia bacterium]|nr:aminodeoxychorismate/anthranilate synthase component II [Bacteroidia bacterium]HRU66999.1 aminodeoxychorismate/anthranilate synthase component II [Bacteroidia bacterium]
MPSKKPKQTQILIIDFYDSFTYNIRQYLLYAGCSQIEIVRYHELKSVDIQQYSGIILSPGPGLPADYPALNELLREVEGNNIPVLGICLGHQAIAAYYGASLRQFTRPLHGKASNIYVCKPTSALFKNLPEVFRAGRYHSWYVDHTDLPDCLEVTAILKDGIIMGIRHKKLPVEGIQFHPESIITRHGIKVLGNWLEMIDSYRDRSVF